MTTEKGTVPLERAEYEVGLALRRLGLLHLAYAETLVSELGDERGRQMIVKAMRNYGYKITRDDRETALEQGLEPTPDNVGIGGRNYPTLGATEASEVLEVQGEERVRVYGCKLAKAWKEFDGEELGGLYCLIDAAKMMAFNPAYKTIHLKTVPQGDAYCEMALRKTTVQEQEDFASDGDWSHADTVG